mmetsp:Transcript_21109/g.63168  ORF Transcript_21109/g.63168 Transcript_21109/m.63168 type:complete len:210 (-) Transcript_21109:1344-1973(-)
MSIADRTSGYSPQRTRCPSCTMGGAGATALGHSGCAPAIAAPLPLAHRSCPSNDGMSALCDPTVPTDGWCSAAGAACCDARLLEAPSSVGAMLPPAGAEVSHEDGVTPPPACGERVCAASCCTERRMRGAAADPPPPLPIGGASLTELLQGVPQPPPPPPPMAPDPGRHVMLAHSIASAHASLCATSATRRSPSCDASDSASSAWLAAQ